MLFDLGIYLNAVTALFVIIDPIGTALIFNALMGSSPNTARYRVAIKAVSISLFLLISFALYGQSLLQSLGISIEALRIAGGLLLFFTAFNMVTRDLQHVRVAEGADVSVFPMSVPLIAGPGSLTMAVLLFSSAESVGNAMSVVLAIVSIGALTLLALCLSASIKMLIGRTGDEILRRFLGVLLAALAIQFVMDGVRHFPV